MKRQNTILFLIVLALIGATAGVLAHAKANQKLGAPGVKTAPLAGGNLEVLLPADLPGYKSEALVQAAIVTNMLPQDTSYGQRIYTADDGSKILVRFTADSTTTTGKQTLVFTGRDGQMVEVLVEVA